MSTDSANGALPDEESVALARESAQALARLLRDRPDSDRARVKLDGQDLVLPRHALALLRDLLTDMAQGHAVTVVPRHAELTTQQAAEMLNVSRPHLIKLLENGDISFTKAGSHRRIRFEDVAAYKAQQKERSQARLAELARLAQEDDLGY
ncbi:helix-turn-helix domain-containing protein [Salinisphaera sp.]|uniref:helix-turn-helix domain-containing protein n=1 Tax=Salinisphaera sp. TaxID=1914330 RepID=UPI000C6A1F3F|nr:helix-turn-helix domain-containing protein [Salinisphaera sp.]MBS62580.1 DNA-binding protein [Salinisphaera sp.]